MERYGKKEAFLCSKIFLKKINFFYFFLQINIFSVFLDHFNMLISKIILKNKIKIILIYFFSEKHFKKQSQLHFQTWYLEYKECDIFLL